MLYTETVEPSTLDLLIWLQRMPELSSMRLVGGTALALHLGHRKSVADYVDMLNCPNKTGIM